MPLKIIFTHQSQGNNFADWFNLLTLCLAPVIAHIVAGVHEPVCLGTAPRWIRRISFYNPTTILWRYFAILDRRFRARSWNQTDLAACNADIWTGSQWDGSEEMMVRSRMFCTRLPNNSRVYLLSTSFTKTAIVTFQGVQAIYDLLHRDRYANTIRTATVFSPLAVFGLLRLPAAMWLTDDYSYANLESLYIKVNHTTPPTLEVANDPNEECAKTSEAEGGETEPSRVFAYTALPPEQLLQVATCSSDLTMHSPAAGLNHSPLYPATSWRGIVVRILYILPILALETLCVYYLYPKPQEHLARATATTFCQDIFFLIFLTTTGGVFLFYFARGNSMSTIIPCVDSAWYITYTVLLIAMALTMLLVSGLEMRKAWCGSFTTYRPKFDRFICRE